MKMRSKRFFMRLFFLFVVVLSLGQIAMLHHYNHLFTRQKRVTTQEINLMENGASVLPPQSKQRLETLKQTYSGVTVSPDGQYATYVNTASNGTDVAHVIKLQSGKQLSEATDLYPVQYITWLGDAEIFVGEQLSPGNLELNTFYVANGAQAGQTAATVPKFSSLAPDAAITKVTYSAQTNDVFVLISTGSSSVIYHIGTMENTQLVPFTSGYVKNIAMTQTGHKLYVEANSGGTWQVDCLQQATADNPNSPQYDAATQFVQPNAALIAVVGNQLYYGKVNGNGLVTSVYRKQGTGASTLVKQLSGPTSADQIFISSSGRVEMKPVATESATM